ncbi:MAG: peptidylprolyl isomerase, partial [Bacteroidaceae bacterium]|nr:peptidylprolyl isomerase [Bacteroidaceae bacterium]
FNLTDPKKVSKIVESEFGFHIIQLIEKRGDKINTRHILRKPRVASADLEAGIARLDSIADDIRSEKFPFEEAAAALSADKDTRNNRGLMANQKDGTPKFEMQDLPAEIAKVVDKMQVGEISKAFTMVNSKGKEVCAIVKLRQRVNGHKATLKDDFQRLKDVVVEKKREEKLEQWIKDKLKNTYVRVNDDFKNCNFKYSGWIK